MKPKRVTKFVQSVNRAIKSFSRETDKQFLVGFVIGLVTKEVFLLLFLHLIIKLIDMVK